MKMTGVALVAACLALEGCATSPSDDSGLSAVSAPTTGDESANRLRARIHTELAANYFDIGNVAVALEEVKEALRADPNFGPAYNVAGLIYGQLKEDRLAEESYQRALSINPTDPDAHHNYGMFLCERKQEKEVKEGERVLRSERYYGKVSRSFQLGQDIDEAKAAAKFNDGVLELTLPKKAAAAAKRLTID